jgi:hypothetical protein
MFDTSDENLERVVDDLPSEYDAAEYQPLAACFNKRQEWENLRFALRIEHVRRNAQSPEVAQWFELNQERIPVIFDKARRDLNCISGCYGEGDDSDLFRFVSRALQILH